MNERPETARVGARLGRGLVLTVVALVVLTFGLVGGAVFSSYRLTGSWNPLSAATPATGEAVEAGESEQLYTCGMHPNVIQKGPGDCPICHMKLTPLRMDGDADAAVGGPQERKVLYWRAPMDPGYVSEKPGKSPMGMDLVPVYASADESSVGKAITVDPATQQNMGIRTARVKRGPLTKTIRTVGRVDYNEQTVTFVDTKFEGWIEKLVVDKTGMAVGADQPLFDVYSPRLWEAQEEYLAAIRGVTRMAGSPLAEAREEAQRLVQAAETQLRYFDITAAQIAGLRRSGSSSKTLTINSPSTGIVTEKMALEGMYVRPGMRLYTIADLSKVWVFVDIYEYQLPWVRVGQEAEMTLPYIPGETFRGHVDYVYPYLQKDARVIKVRLEFDNPHQQLKPDMYATVQLQADLNRRALLIPREAYIDSGTRQVAFVMRGDKQFQPRDLQVGVEGENGLVEVLFGLEEGEEVVTSGQFMLDAESKLKEAVAKMLTAQQSAPAPAGSTIDSSDMQPQAPGHNH